jgi:zinc/manganese transport system permease protein
MNVLDALGHPFFANAMLATIAIAVLMGTLGHKGVADDVVIGNISAWILGLGVFFLTVYTTSRSTANGSAGVTVLFGSIFGLSSGDTITAAVVARSCACR